MKNRNNEQLIETCKKESAFAGFWYESYFFNHYKNFNHILIRYITPRKKVPKHPLKLLYTDVVYLPGDEDRLEIGLLHEMKSRFPIIDSVGYLSQEKSN